MHWTHPQLAKKRPVSPHVFEIDKPTEPHYKMPINAISSIASRVTGCVLSGSACPPAASHWSSACGVPTFWPLCELFWLCYVQSPEPRWPLLPL